MLSKTKGSLFILSGPSGVGKSTVIAEVLRQRPDIYFSVSFTTRPPREGDQEGVTYHFVSTQEFEEKIRDGELLEYANYAGNYYGTSGWLIDEQLERGTDVLLDIEVVGAEIVHSKRPDTPMIFVAPPSFEELSRRIHARNTDSEEVIQRRLTRAQEELKEIPKYEYLIINDSVEQAARDILAILHAGRCRTDKRIEQVRSML